MQVTRYQFEDISRFVLLITQGVFVAGESVSQKDLELAPKLFAIRVGGKHFKNFEIPSELTAVHAYVKVSQNHIPHCDIWNIEWAKVTSTSD